MDRALCSESLQCSAQERLSTVKEQPAAFSASSANITSDVLPEWDTGTIRAPSIVPAYRAAWTVASPAGTAKEGRFRRILTVSAMDLAREKLEPQPIKTTRGGLTCSTRARISGSRASRCSAHLRMAWY